MHISHASHGEGLGRLWGWMLFLAYVPVPAVEAEAIVTYANNYLPYFIQPHSTGPADRDRARRLRHAARRARQAQSPGGADAAERQLDRHLVEDRGAAADYRGADRRELPLGRLGGRSEELSASPASSPHCRRPASSSAISASAPPSISAARAPTLDGTFRWRSSARWSSRRSSTSCFRSPS